MRNYLELICHHHLWLCVDDIKNTDVQSATRQWGDVWAVCGFTQEGSLTAEVSIHMHSEQQSDKTLSGWWWRDEGGRVWILCFSLAITCPASDFCTQRDDGMIQSWIFIQIIMTLRIFYAATDFAKSPLKHFYFMFLKQSVKSVK